MRSPGRRILRGGEDASGAGQASVLYVSHHMRVTQTSESCESADHRAIRLFLMVYSNYGRQNSGVYGSPNSYGDGSDDSVTSAGSMDPHGRNLTPSDSPASPGSPTAGVNIGRLSLENQQRPRDSGEGTREPNRAAVTKRAASTELRRELRKHSPSGRAHRSRAAVAASRRGAHRRNAEHACRLEQGRSAYSQCTIH